MAEGFERQFHSWWRTPPETRRPIGVIVVIVLAISGAVCASCSSSPSSSGTTATSATTGPTFDGLGATASAWSGAHVPDGKSDYGPQVTSGGSSVYEFQAVSEDGGRGA